MRAISMMKKGKKNKKKNFASRLRKQCFLLFAALSSVVVAAR